MHLRSGWPISLLTIFLLAVVWTGTGMQCLWADEPSETATASPDAEAKAEMDEAEYYELLKLFADTIDQIERNYVKPVDRRKLMEAAIRGLTTELDPYSTYIGPKEVDRFRRNIDSEFGGVGIQVAIEKGQLTIISPLVGTPAYRAGLKAGDRIMRIEDVSTEGITLTEAVRRMKGKPDTDVKVTVIHAHNFQEETVTLTRELIRVATVLGDHRDEDDNWDFMLNGEEKVGYIRLTAFSRHTSDELRDAVGLLQSSGMQALVLDLRYNPGGLLSSAVEVSDMFVSSGIIVSTEGRNTAKREWLAHSADTYDDFPMAVLVNHFSASASEIVSACLQDLKRAVIVGERTWGKGSVQEVINLESGRSALKLTTAGYQRPNGKNIHRFHGAKSQDEWGVTPNDGYLVELTREESHGYLEYRRQRDIVTSRDPTDPADESKSDAEDADSQPNPDKDDATDQPPGSDSKKPAGEDAKPSSDETEEEAGGAESENPPQDDSATPPSNEDEQPTEEATPKFVDLQLEKALEYLREELRKTD